MTFESILKLNMHGSSCLMNLSIDWGHCAQTDQITLHPVVSKQASSKEVTQSATRGEGGCKVWDLVQTMKKTTERHTLKQT